MGGEVHGSLWEESSSRRLITLVSQRPVLWDRACPGHGSKAALAESWRGVCGELEPGFRSMAAAEQELYLRATMKRWKNIRDQWGKTCRKAEEMKKCGLPSAKQYIYHDQLLFLEKSSLGFNNDTFEMEDLENSNLESAVFIKEENIFEDSNDRESESNFDTRDPLNEQIPDVRSELGLDGEPSPQIEIRKTEYQSDPTQITVTRIQTDSAKPAKSTETRQTSNYQQTETNQSTVPKRINSLAKTTLPNSSRISREVARSHTDESKLCFFKSVLPSLKDFTDDEVLELQGGMISLIQRIKRARQE